MPHPLASLIDRLERARKSIFRRQLPHHGIALPRVAPHVGKPEEVEGRRQRRFFVLTGRSAGPEVDQLGLVRMQLQPELTQPLVQDREHTFRIDLVHKAHHKVVTEAHQRTRTAQPWSHLLGVPEIDHMMKKDVTQDWGNNPTLRRTGLGVMNLPRFQHTGFEPFVDQLPNYPIGDSSRNAANGMLSKYFLMSTSSTQ